MVYEDILKKVIKTIKEDYKKIRQEQRSFFGLYLKRTEFLFFEAPELKQKQADAESLAKINKSKEAEALARRLKIESAHAEQDVIDTRLQKGKLFRRCHLLWGGS